MIDATPYLPFRATRNTSDGHSERVYWEIAEAAHPDVPSWLEIVREVEPLFGPMPTFEITLARNIARGTALCVRDHEATVLGGVLIRPVPHSQISWLAVRKSARGRRIGHTLVADALSRYASAAEVVVDTFGDDNQDGHAARRLYESFGFQAAEHLDRGPEGGTRQRFRLVRE